MRIKWAGTSRQDLEAIELFIAQDNPIAAERVGLAIVQAVQSLSAMPGRGRPARFKRTRELILSPLPYIIVYRVQATGVEIIRIRHASQRR